MLRPPNNKSLPYCLLLNPSIYTPTISVNLPIRFINVNSIFIWEGILEPCIFDFLLSIFNKTCFFNAVLSLDTESFLGLIKHKVEFSIVFGSYLDWIIILKLLIDVSNYWYWLLASADLTMGHVEKMFNEGGLILVQLLKFRGKIWNIQYPVISNIKSTSQSSEWFGKLFFILRWLWTLRKIGLVEIVLT